MTRNDGFISSLRHDEANALVEGRHGDPFSILGPHEVGGEREVRIIAPGAISIEIIDRGARRPLGRLHLSHAAGLFEGVIEGDGQYIARIQWPDAIQETEDPYSFGLLLGELDLHLISQGTHYELGHCLGAQPMTIDGVNGVRFAVWAPNARRVSVVGGFNSWDGRRHPMRLRREAGVWELFVPRLGVGDMYKYEIVDANGYVLPQKADPVARASEAAPGTASIVARGGDYEWTDSTWISNRRGVVGVDQPISIYEVQAGSWMRIMEDGGRSLNWAEMGERLLPYVAEMGFTHVEFMPIAEYPFGGSWGYQPLGLFSPTGRYGTAEEFAALVDRCHGAGIGVIVDWVPAHFPSDVWGLARFDGGALYEHEDPREGYHQDWNTLIYNLGRNEVKGFLIASALEWIERFHVDMLRVDAVASMLYRDYSRKHGEWIPNRYGGRENLEAVEFFKHLNSIVVERNPGVHMVAEESTAWPGVTQPVSEGGLGFSLKWNMGWMHDTLDYMEKDPVYRRYNHGSMTFAMVYAYTERFVLPLSHDEVVHGKGSLINKMPGDVWQKFANLRAYYGWMWGFPGKKLLFMGGEIGQWHEWKADGSIDWDLLDFPNHRGVQSLVRDLNHIYLDQPALYATDNDAAKFDWAVSDDAENSVFGFLRWSPDSESCVLCISNMTPVPRFNYRVGVPEHGEWREILNTDGAAYGGANMGNGGRAATIDVSTHGKRASLDITLPPLSTCYFAWRR